MKHVQILKVPNEPSSTMSNWSHAQQILHTIIIFIKNTKELFQKNEKAIGLWMETIFGEVDIDLIEVHKTIIPDIPPWTIKTSNINLKLYKFYKKQNSPTDFLRGIRKS